MRAIVLICAATALAACDLPPPSPERAAAQCEERARAAQGPTGELTIGANSQTGGFVKGSVGITSDYLRGEDPIAIYESCVLRLTGQPPIRPPALRY